jgi:hypothetical protein
VKATKFILPAPITRTCNCILWLLLLAVNDFSYAVVVYLTTLVPLAPGLLFYISNIALRMYVTSLVQVCQAAEKEQLFNNE